MSSFSKNSWLGFLAGCAVPFLLAGCGGSGMSSPASHTVIPTSVLPGAPGLAIGGTAPDLSGNNYVEKFTTRYTPIDIALGSDKNMWFTLRDTVTKLSYIGQIDASGTQHYYQNSGGHAVGIVAGKVGTLWFADLNANIGRIATATGTITTYVVAGASETYNIAKGPDGNMWFTDYGSSSIGRITPSGTATLFTIPSNAQPLGITAGPDGNLWFSAIGGTTNVQEFGKITTAGSITEYPIPSGDTGQPTRMIKGPDGNLYSTVSSGGVYAVTTAGVISYFPTSTSANEFAAGITVGPDKQIWVAQKDPVYDLIKFNPRTGQFSKPAQVPTAICPRSFVTSPEGLALGPDDDMWFVGVGNGTNCGYIGVYEDKITTIGIRLNGEMSITDPNYGFELGYALGTTSNKTQTIGLSMGESVLFENVDTVPHSAALLGNATSTSAPWPSTFNGSTIQSSRGTAIGSAGFATGSLDPGTLSPLYETGLPGFYMIGCQYHYNTNEMRTVVVVH